MFCEVRTGAETPNVQNWGKNRLDAMEAAVRLPQNPTLNVGILLGLETNNIDVDCDGANSTRKIRECMS